MVNLPKALVLLVLLCVPFTLAEQLQRVEVNLKQGPIFAIGQPLADGRAIYSFKGIPYAKPPVGDLRFMPPVAAEGWSVPRDGSLTVPECSQYDFFKLWDSNEKIRGDEDCLYLNVFTPRPTPSDLPVMLFIHGGGFHGGGITDIQPYPLLRQDVVLVTIQYRLGVLGFLSMEDTVLPGNMGLKDQVMALQWVHDNIHDLGGDPNSVTIFGESAGAASVQFHMISPYSKGLFQKAILQSGCLLCPWALSDDSRGEAKKIAQKMNCPSDDSQELLSCVRAAPFEDVAMSCVGLGGWLGIPPIILPRVDGDYLPDHPAKLLHAGKYSRVPIMAGIVKDEGALFPAIAQATNGAFDLLNDNFADQATAALVFTDDNALHVAKRLFYKYIGSTHYSAEHMDEFVSLMGDRYLRKCLEDATDLHVRDSLFGNDVYLYEFSHQGENSFIDNFGMSELKYVCHIDELQYLFNASFGFKPFERVDDQFVSEIMVALWTNFAKTGNPTPDLSLGFKWLPRTLSDRRYLEITTVPTMMKDNLEEEREFWRNLPIEENKRLYPERFKKTASDPSF